MLPVFNLKTTLLISISIIEWVFFKTAFKQLSILLKQSPYCKTCQFNIFILEIFTGGLLA